MATHSILEMLELVFIEEMEVNCPWNLSAIPMFVIYLGQIRPLHKLLSQISVSEYISPKQHEWQIAMFTF
jgi:hypothetical protein